MNEVVLSFGGGVNSTALLVGLESREERPDLILFADTGGELPATYLNVAAMSAWCLAHDFPEIVTVRYDSGPNKTLEDECLANTTLPSLAFGNRGCSVKWKRQPQQRYLRDWAPARDAWARGEAIESLIGIDAGEAHRGKFPPDKKYRYRFPLIEWGWARDECIQVIRDAGIPLPRKSACWFCPASKKGEVLELARDQPELFDRAVHMERNAKERLVTVRGLGRRWSWEALERADRAQLKLFPEAPEIACMCFDGEE